MSKNQKDAQDYAQEFERMMGDVIPTAHQSQYHVKSPPISKKTSTINQASNADMALFENNFTQYHDQQDDINHIAQRETPSPIIYNTRNVARQISDGGIDKRLFQRLKRGNIPIEDDIDLHGCDEKTARLKVKNFIYDCYAQHKRCLLIMTGKGKGILQKSIRQYIDHCDICDMILATSTAQPKDGGSGAIYIYLRKNKKP